jgi:hypothetical protein
VQELIHLPRAGETRFIQNVEVPLAIALCFLHQMPLKGAGFDAGFNQLLRCSEALT